MQEIQGENVEAEQKRCSKVETARKQSGSSKDRIRAFLPSAISILLTLRFKL